ncbi:hypothetical protein BCR43DRAFT_499827 [Syncephalastrum racemosum]|uniref:Thioredoxin domain-containing protein n=1 Tax=Syncephalastrum racemosum TaxID=13706 RepID=A0A1X2GZN9_SYNRA|nr:hypothetical protein BCR43DRAFT_499827 [Syncephalastrum racemosum]
MDDFHGAIVRRLLHRYYVLHLLYGITYAIYFAAQRLDLASPGFGFTDGEMNAYVALSVLSAWKCVMASTAEELASVLILYTKFFSLCLFYWKSGLWTSALYAIGWIVLSTLFPQPWYQGPTKIIELSESDFISKVTKKPKSKERIVEVNEEGPKYWVIMLYANWSVACLNFEAVLANLSLKYSTEHLQFGKVDIDLYPDVGDTYGISRDPASFDLPTLLLFSDGNPIRRLPELTMPSANNNTNSSMTTSAKDTITRIGWSKKAGTVVTAFQLDRLAVDKSS